MDKKIKQRWVEALRSGEYVQGMGKLRQDVVLHPQDPPAYCCLGVLCEIAAKEGVVQWTGYSYIGKDGIQSGHLLPPAVMDWADLPIGNPMVTAPDTYPMQLGALNDDFRLSFNQIADAIETSL